MATFGDVEILWGFGPDVSCMDPRVLAQMPNLKALFRSGSGIDALPCAWAKEHGIGIYNTPESIAECVAKRYDRSRFLLTNKLTEPYFNSQEEIRTSRAASRR